MDIDTGTPLAKLGGHHFGIGCVTFRPGGKYLVSVGFEEDKKLVLWEWSKQRLISSHKVGNKVNAISFHESGAFFVTAGDRHLKACFFAYMLYSSLLCFLLVVVSYKDRC